MKLGEKGAALIKSFESCRLRAYMPTPDDVWTCGWGSTRGVTKDTVWTQEEADARFLEDVAQFEECVNDCVSAALTQNEFDACVSLAFNIGCTAFRNSTLVKLLNLADYNGASLQFLRWNRQAGKVLNGLTRRRIAERELFESQHT